MAITADFSLDRAASWSAEITLEDAAAGASDLTGITLHGQIRRSYTSPTTAAELTIQVIDAPAGRVRLSMTAEQTQSLTPRRYVYDILAVDDATGERARVVEGQIEVTPAVTLLPTV